MTGKRVQSVLHFFGGGLGGAGGGGREGRIVNASSGGPTGFREMGGFPTLRGTLLGPYDKGILLFGDLSWGSPILVNPCRLNLNP